jgi:hypothetical protein
MAPWADLLYACDGDWWDEYIGEARRTFSGELWTFDSVAAERHGLRVAKGLDERGLGRDIIHTGNNSGYQAINLVYLRGAARIILLGYDMKRGPTGKLHWHGDHPRGLNRGCAFSTWLKRFPALAEDLKSEGVSVINATRDTALECFPKMRLEEALC